MDDVGCKTVVNESGVDAEGWRAGFNWDAREKVVNRIVETLKNQVPCSDANALNELKNVAVKFEDKIFCDAATKDDYTYRICHRMLKMENLKYQNVSTSSSTPGISQTTKLEVVGHSSSLQNVSGFSHELVGNSVGQHVRSNAFANTQREMQGSQPSQQVAFQPHQRQHLPHQFLKQKVQKQNIHPSFMQPNIHYSHHDQQQQQILSQPTPLQSSQQLMLPTQQPRQLIGQQLNTTLLQQNHQFGQQNNLSEHQLQQPSFYMQNMSNSFQQPLNPQSNVSGVQQQQKIVGPQSDVLNMQVHQHSVNILQQAETNTAQKNVPWTSQTLQLHKLLGSQQKNNSLPESTPHRPQTSPALLQPQNVIDKQKQLLKSQRVLPEASSVPVESTAHIENPNTADWYDQAYQKLQPVREKVLSELLKAYKSVHSICLKALEPGVAEKWKNKKSTLEKMIRFLQLSRSDIVHCPKDKVVYYQHMILNYWSSICKSHGSAQNQGPQLQVPGSQSLTQLQQQRNMKPSLSPMNLISSTPAGTIPMLSTHQGVPNSQPNTSSLQSSSQVGSEQRNALSPFHQTFMKPMQQNVVNVLQATNSPSNTTLDHTMSSPQPSSAGATFPQLKQQQKHQIMQTQKLKPQMHQQWIHRKQQMMQKMYDSDGSVKPLIGVSSGMVQQHHSTGQNLDYLHQSLLSANPHHLHATSPQTSQHSCPQIDQQNYLSPLSKSGTPLQSDASLFIVPSPSTPLTPSSVPVDLDKHPSGVLPLSVAENNGHPQTPVALAQVQIQNQALTMGTPGISVSPLLAELTSPDGNEQSRIMEQPLDRLLKAVKSISPKALSASVQEIGSVGSMIDRIARTTDCNESRAAISLDLVANTRYHLQVQNLSGSPPSEKMNRHISAMAFDELSPSVIKVNNLKQLRGQISDIDSTANSRIKRPRIEPCNELLEEIRHINQRQVEIVVDIVSVSAEDVGTASAGEGTTVRCSYNAVALRENFKLKCAASQILSILPIWFLVPANYPNSSPTVLDKLPFDWSSNRKEHEDLSQKARSRFNLSLRNLSQPMSLTEMAKTWEVCAHSVFYEYAQLMGGECFTSRYGTWENCVVAS